MKGKCMKEYTSFIIKVLKSCLFFSAFGALILWGTGYESFILGWLWGQGITILYVLLLRQQYKKLGNTPTFQMIGQARWQMTQRMLLVLSLVIIGTQIHEINTYVVVGTVSFMQILLYGVYWYISK